MAERDIIQNLISKLGQSQDKRMPQELKVHHVDIDERTVEDFLLFAGKLARFLNFYNDNTETPYGNWQNFFPHDIDQIKNLINSNNEQTQPHHALFLSFLELYKEPQKLINQITEKHLNFFYQDILRFQKKKPIPDKVHLVLELKKNMEPISIGPENIFTAGKDKSGTELLYTPTLKTIINQSKIESIKSIYIENGKVYYAPIANSADGVGAELDKDDAKWDAFGSTYSIKHAAETGFAISSPVLLMAEGSRNIIVTIALKNLNLNIDPKILENAFDIFVTGEKQWLGPYIITPIIDLNNSILLFDFTIPKTEMAIINYDKNIHGYSYSADSPVIKVLLNQSSQAYYANLKNLQISKVKIKVKVSEISSLSLENDSGKLDQKKAFYPFGNQPVIGSRFLVGYAEAFAKKLSQIIITIDWKGAPEDFSDYYHNYSETNITNEYFTANVIFDAKGDLGDEQSKCLFDPQNAGAQNEIEFINDAPVQPSSSYTISENLKNYALLSAKSNWAMRKYKKNIALRPVFKDSTKDMSGSKSGFMTFFLEKSFQHAEYRKQYVENTIKYTTNPDNPFVALNEPYTPVIKKISMAYHAYTDDVDIASVSQDDFSNSDINFYHIAYFGQMLEHAYQRSNFSFLHNNNVTLFYTYENEGELLLGFSNLNPNDSVSVLFQVANGSNDPDLDKANIDWYVLCDNYWEKLNTDNLVLDTTNMLLTSGIIRFIIPSGATVQNTILPENYLWIKGAVKQNTKAICKLINVCTNGLEAQFTDVNNKPDHLKLSLEKNKITKFKNGHSSVKSITQPYASFGGRMEDTDDLFYTRSSERLRHKGRCISSWDYERIVLEAFPKIHKVKCIPHARYIPDSRNYCWLAPGNVLLIVIPDIKNQNAISILEPKADKDTLEKIALYLKKIVGMQVNISVRNPGYQKIQLNFKVKFKIGNEFNFYKGKLMQQIIAFLSPWAFAPTRDVSFGGIVYKSVLIDFIEELSYVDYVMDFKMYSYIDAPSAYIDISEVRPEAPNIILVSEKFHVITQV
jgi:hypothetical protein